MACQLADFRLNDVDAIATESCEIAGGSRMSHHVEVHRRSDKDRTTSREICRHQHIVGHTVGHFCEGRSRSRSNDHSVSPKAEVDMRVPFAGIGGEELAYDRFSR